MSDIKFKSTLVDGIDNQQEVTVRFFKITDIPDVMASMGWIIAEKFMRKWFNDSLYEMTREEKIGGKDMATIDKEHVLTDLDFEWLLKSERVAKIFSNYVLSVSFVKDYHEFLGKKATTSNALSNGLSVIISRIEQNGFFDRGSATFRECNMDFTSLSAMDLENKSQFNFIRIGSTIWEKGTDELDDVYGALGSFIIKAAFTKMRIKSVGHECYKIIIDELGWYVRDTYDFINDNSDQLLGYWGWEGVKRPNLINWLKEPPLIECDGNDYYRVTNDSFVQYRNNIGKKETPPETGDFFVFSTVKKTPVSITIHLDASDIKEYVSKTESKK
ncbi:DUF6402 family protein [Cronobacter dublinensis]|uniref:DUF6402 family protein n=1 Tax=Cronobacter dublinensis TaxID=413497 RepID=UPI001376151F|nr:DUF6402 family protein [Cronobacter dublinensis]EKY3089509.1 hypothetical protein [Cronobacter dublinensis]ELQ6229275.1 hypothetical protein [Cronobacter dublinensis]ELY5818738.1 hypothetical protein [Cronobacter dublinensis]EMD9247170.1 hypothetical protein [Cronobacter dublinensis]MDI6444741.1 DUF6402 family protein [Cronobacter dublinensis]